MSAHVLVIEDEKDISDIITMSLESKGHKTSAFYDGPSALAFLQNNEVPHFDLVVLDRMLPGANGLEICKFLRLFQKTKNHPVLMVTALSRPEDIVEGLEAGADDYVTKPFDLNILNARINALLRRSKTIGQEKKQTGNILNYKDFKIDIDQCKAWGNDKLLELTLSEFKLLHTFLKSPGKVHTRSSLVAEIQGGPVFVTDRTIDTHIFGLRKKLGDLGQLIETIRGVGYRVASIE
jgi:DNA-binding response OmpR family regulator